MICCRCGSEVTAKHTKTDSRLVSAISCGCITKTLYQYDMHKHNLEQKQKRIIAAWNPADLHARWYE